MGCCPSAGRSSIARERSAHAQVLQLTAPKARVGHLGARCRYTVVPAPPPRVIDGLARRPRKNRPRLDPVLQSEPRRHAPVIDAPTIIIPGSVSRRTPRDNSPWCREHQPRQPGSPMLPTHESARSPARKPAPGLPPHELNVPAGFPPTPASHTHPRDLVARSPPPRSTRSVCHRVRPLRPRGSGVS